MKSFRERKAIENNILKKEMRERERNLGFYSRKGGGHPFFIALSLIGVLIGIALVMHGMNGGNLSSGLVLVLGLFVTIKEILDKKKLDEWHAYWLSEQILWLKKLGLDINELKIREHTKEELSHYSSATFDIDYEYPFGSKEVAGNANRGQYDLTQHEKESKESMEIFDEKYMQSMIVFSIFEMNISVLSIMAFSNPKKNLFFTLWNCIAMSHVFLLSRMFLLIRSRLLNLCVVLS